MEGPNGQDVKEDVELPRPLPRTLGHQGTLVEEPQGGEQGIDEA